jgi:hypothetical protein
MNRWRSRESPFGYILRFDPKEIDDICEDALSGVNLLPPKPGPVRVDRFIEKHFSIVVDYVDLEEGFLGFTQFSKAGKVLRIAVSRLLSHDSGKIGERRERSTIAHEAGHGLLHAQLFMDDDEMLLSVKQHLDAEPKTEKRLKILCRATEIGGVDGTPKKSQPWWEWQANRAIGGLLLPRNLTRIFVEPYLSVSKVGLPELTHSRDQAIRATAETFEVNPIVARIRLQELFPPPDHSALF